MTVAIRLMRMCHCHLIIQIWYT